MENDAKKTYYTVEINGKKREYPAGSTLLKIAEDVQPEYKHDIVLAQTGSRLLELNHELERDCSLKFVTTGDPVGNKTYKRSVCFMLVKAVYDVCGHDKVKRVRILHSVSKGQYCEAEGDFILNQQLLDAVRSRMLEMVEEKMPIRKQNIRTDDAVELFGRYGMTSKERLFRYRRVSRVNTYRMNEFEDYYYGYMVPHAGYLKYFDLFLYDDGFVLQLPTTAEPESVPSFQPQEKLFHVMKEATVWGDMLGIDTVGALNDRITHEDPHQLILVQEAMQEKKIAQIAEQIASMPEKKFILIAGPSSSGKTTFSRRLSIQLQTCGKKPHPISVDNYFVNREDTPLDEFGQLDYECLGAIDVDLLNQNLTDLLAGLEVELPVFNFKTGKRETGGGSRLKLGEDDILVLEGIHCLNDALTCDLPKKNKFKIYISALTQLNVDEHNPITTTDGRLIRRIVRDARTRGTTAQKTIAMWPSVRRGEEKNIFPYQEDADVMFNSALIYELSVLKSYAEPLLFGIDKNAPEYVEAKRILKFLDYFVGVGSEKIPMNSLLREFIGGGCFNL